MRCDSCQHSILQGHTLWVGIYIWVNDTERFEELYFLCHDCSAFSTAHPSDCAECATDERPTGQERIAS